MRFYHHIFKLTDLLHHLIIHLLRGWVGGTSQMIRGILLEDALERALSTLSIFLLPQHVRLVGADGGAHAGAVLAVNGVHGRLEHVRQDLQDHGVGGAAARGHNAAVLGARQAARQSRPLRLLAEVQPHGEELRLDHPTAVLSRSGIHVEPQVVRAAEQAREGGARHDLRLVVVQHDMLVVPRGNGLHQLVEALPVAARVRLAHLRVTPSTRRHVRAWNVSVLEAQHRHELAYASAACPAPTVVGRTDEHVALLRRLEGVREGEHLRGKVATRTHGVAGAHAHRNVALAAQAQAHQRARVVARAAHDLAGGRQSEPSTAHTLLEPPLLEVGTHAANDRPAGYGFAQSRLQVRRAGVQAAGIPADDSRAEPSPAMRVDVQQVHSAAVAEVDGRVVAAEQ